MQSLVDGMESESSVQQVVTLTIHTIKRQKAPAVGLLHVPKACLVYFTIPPGPAPHPFDI